MEVKVNENGFEYILTDDYVIFRRDDIKKKGFIQAVINICRKTGKKPPKREIRQACGKTGKLYIDEIDFREFQKFKEITQEFSAILQPETMISSRKLEWQKEMENLKHIIKEIERANNG